jgi:hypothetical protein
MAFVGLISVKMLDDAAEVDGDGDGAAGRCLPLMKGLSSFAMVSILTATW